MPDATTTDSLSVIIPVFNEEQNLSALHRELMEVLNALAHQAEIIYVDDGSRDRSVEIIRSLISNAELSQKIRIRLVRLRRNYGQTTAFMAGIDSSRHSIIVLMDADLQNDPRDIPVLLQQMNEGYDVVSGWRRERKDPFWSKKIPSRLANLLISSLSGVRMHDYGCSLKAYRRDCLSGFRLYGEMHRFIPIYAHWQGARITEIPVNHRPRQHGQSHYGLSRTFKVLMDLIVVIFLHEYQQKPMYVFGSAALVSFLLSGFSGVWALYYKFFGDKSLIQTPLPLLCVMCFLTAVMCFLMGLLAELLIRIYYESQNKLTYAAESQDTDVSSLQRN
ncbi:MAG: glycosyltransferase family 2 protein [Candidatus Methylacidiphilales bacterium]